MLPTSRTTVSLPLPSLFHCAPWHTGAMPPCPHSWASTPWPPWGQEAALVAHLPRTPLLSRFLPEIPDRRHPYFPALPSAVSTPSPSISCALEVPGTSRRRQLLRRIPFSLPTGRIEPGRSIADGRVLASSPPRPRSAGRIPVSPSLPRSRRPLPNGCW